MIDHLICWTQKVLISGADRLKQAYLSITGKSNSKPFNGFFRGELVLLGVKSRMISDGDDIWEVEFTFGAGATLHDLNDDRAVDWSYADFSRLGIGT